MNVKTSKIPIPTGLFETVYRMPLWQKVLILLGSWIVPLVLFWILFLSARIGEMDSISGKIPKLQHEIEVLETKRKQLPKMEKELEAMQRILNQAVKLLPEKEDIPSVLTEISILGNEARLEFQAFKPGKEKKEKFYAAIPVSLEFSGPFHNTLVFFDKISRMARIVHIKDVSMGNARQSAQVWSQVGGNQGNGNSVQAESPAASAEGADSGSDVVQRGGSWVINTRCTAVTYRFLTPKEQQHSKKKRKKRKR